MRRKDDGSPEERIPRLLRLAFAHAKKGDEKTARSYWKSLLNSGYIEDGETKHEFEKAVLAGLREHGLVPPVMIHRRLNPGVPRGFGHCEPGAPNRVPKPLERSDTGPDEVSKPETT